MIFVSLMKFRAGLDTVSGLFKTTKHFEILRCLPLMRKLNSILLVLGVLRVNLSLHTVFSDFQLWPHQHSTNGDNIAERDHMLSSHLILSFFE
jgi:hypothetical protein